VSFFATLRRNLPRPLKAAAWSAYRFAASGAAPLRRDLRYRLLDLKDALKPGRPLTPPRRLWGLVTAPENDFHTAGAEFRDLLTAYGLKPNHRVLDVGCGVGRLALPLTGYLSPEGGFDGFDIMPVAIGWCRRAITPRFPNFRFVLADVQSDRYHPGGASTASTYVFPYEDATFDYVFLGSVFTHMFPADVANYLAQIARVMRPGGVCLISYYLLNANRHAAIARSGTAFSFSHAGEGYRAEFAHLPEAAIAFEEEEIVALYRANGLELAEIRYGTWSESPVQGQDLVVARKPL
jgi:SAM-dependent methyltransferase